MPRRVAELRRIRVAQIQGTRSLVTDTWRWGRGGADVGQRWDRGGTEVGRRWDRGGTEMGQRWDRDWAEMGQRWDRGSKKVSSIDVQCNFVNNMICVCVCVCVCLGGKEVIAT